jgi:hypothetical protein
MSIYRSYKVQTDYVEIKFVESIQVSTLVNANFLVYNTTTATPALLASPFQTINVVRDYDSISRILLLWWTSSTTLSDNSDYEIRISGLKNVIGSTIDDEIILFSTETITTDPIEDLDEPPTRLPIDVEDYSIKEVSFATTLTASSSSTFTVESVTPNLENSFYLDPSFNEGKIEVYFNQSPAANFVSSEYFKVQRKLITRGINTWSNVTALVTSNPDDKLIVIYLPSIPATTDVDQTVYYGEPDLVYWEEGYKYRLRISESIGPVTI